MLLPQIIQQIAAIDISIYKFRGAIALITKSGRKLTHLLLAFVSELLILP